MPHFKWISVISLFANKWKLHNPVNRDALLSSFVIPFHMIFILPFVIGFHVMHSNEFSCNLSLSSFTMRIWCRLQHQTKLTTLLHLYRAVGIEMAQQNTNLALGMCHPTIHVFTHHTHVCSATKGFCLATIMNATHIAATITTTISISSLNYYLFHDFYAVVFRVAHFCVLFSMPFGFLFQISTLLWHMHFQLHECNVMPCLLPFQAFLAFENFQWRKGFDCAKWNNSSLILKNAWNVHITSLAPNQSGNFSIMFIPKFLFFLIRNIFFCTNICIFIFIPHFFLSQFFFHTSALLMDLFYSAFCVLWNIVSLFFCFFFLFPFLFFLCFFCFFCFFCLLIF